MTCWLQTLRSLETIYGRIGNLLKKRLNAKEVIFPKQNGNFIFPVADGRTNNHSGRDQELRTSTLIRDHPIRGGHVDFHGVSSTGEALNDFWSMSGKLHIPPSR